VCVCLFLVCLCMCVCARACVGVCMCVYVSVPRVRVCVACACVHVSVPVRWSACTVVLAACAAAGPAGFSAALACAQIDSNRRCRLCLAVRGRAVCAAAHSAYPWVPLLGRCRRRRRRRSSRRSGRCCRRHSLRTPSRLTRACLLQLLRARVCARACACRWRGRSRRWPAGKAPRSPATQPRDGTRLCEAVRGTWGTRSTHRYCEGLACSVP
jgi:hypothetical protein